MKNGSYGGWGGRTDIPVNVRVVSATIRDLPTAVDAGGFREELYYRLNTFVIHIPPLRERREDVQALADHFLDRYAREMRKPVRGFSPEAVALLQAHPFPGNVRELRNLVERAVILSSGDEVSAEDIRFDVARAASSGPLDPPPMCTGLDQALRRFPDRDLDLEDFQKAIVEEALRRAGGNQVRAAGMLGISRDALRRRMKRHGIGDGEPE